LLLKQHSIIFSYRATPCKRGTRRRPNLGNSILTSKKLCFYRHSDSTSLKLLCSHASRKSCTCFPWIVNFCRSNDGDSPIAATPATASQTEWYSHRLSLTYDQVPASVAVYNS